MPFKALTKGQDICFKITVANNKQTNQSPWQESNNNNKNKLWLFSNKMHHVTKMFSKKEMVPFVKVMKKDQITPQKF